MSLVMSQRRFLRLFYIHRGMHSLAFIFCFNFNVFYRFICTSVCPSVRYSRAWISQKRLKLGL